MKKIFEGFRKFRNEARKDLSSDERVLVDTPVGELTADQKKKREKVRHEWMKEGSLSSDLQERYGISDKDAVGKVLWHSLDDDGKIGVYDMKFGDIIIRNLTEADLKEGKKKKTHEHKVQKEDDEKRARAKLEEEWPHANDPGQGQAVGPGFDAVGPGAAEQYIDESWHEE